MFTTSIRLRGIGERKSIRVGNTVIHAEPDPRRSGILKLMIDSEDDIEQLPAGRAQQDVAPKR